MHGQLDVNMTAACKQVTRYTAVIRPRFNTSHTMAGWLAVSWLITLLAGVRGVEHVCNSDMFKASCEHDEIIIVDEALYGRMEAGRCGVTPEGGQIGCSNDIMFLADSKCSGRRECSFIVGSSEFYDANEECNRDRRAYMRIRFSCIRVAYHPFAFCLTQSQVQVTSAEGFISSHVTDETGCGSARTPWAINARPGQTISVTIMDFGALSRSQKSSGYSCSNIYGYVVEKSVNVNKTICAATERRHELYTSMSNHLEIIVVPQTQRQDDSLFIIHYKVLGCSDLTPPAHAWYKRDGDTATIGCHDNDNAWTLTCNDNSWEGVVGNCSAKPIVSADTDKVFNIDLPLKTLLIVAAIAGATVVLAVLIIVAGVVCVKKYRHESESRANSVPSTLVFKPKFSTQTLPRSQYHAMTIAQAHPGTSTMGTVQRACTMVQRGPPGQRHCPSTTLPASSRWTAQKGVQQRPQRPPAPLPPTAGGAQPEPSTSTGITRTNPKHPLWNQPHPEEQVTSDGVYQNPDEVIGTAFRPHQPLPGTVTTDPDDISSYYAPTTGHKYFVLERQPNQQTNESQS